MTILLAADEGRTVSVVRTPDGDTVYKVTSGQKTYDIRLPEGCPCTNAKHDSWYCKHMTAIELWLRLQGKTLLEGEPPTPAPEPTEPEPPFVLPPALAALVDQAITRYPDEASTIRRAAQFATLPGLRVVNGHAEYADPEGEVQTLHRLCACAEASTAPDNRCLHRWAYTLAKRGVESQEEQEAPRAEIPPAPPVASPLRPLRTILDELSRPLPAQALGKKTVGRGDRGREVTFVPHYIVAALLDAVVPGWQSEIVRMDTHDGALRITLRLQLPTSDYGLVTREDIGEADEWEESPDQYGNPVANAKAAALRRAAAQFGVGRYLYDQKGQLAALAKWLKGPSAGKDAA